MKTRQELRQLYNSSEFQKTYHYEKSDLGATCTEEGTTFLLWCPLGEKVTLSLYRDGEKGEAFARIPLEVGEKGVWKYHTAENLHGIYYDYEILRNGEQVISGDPYAKACGANSGRSMAVDLKKTDPKGWDQDRRPEKPEENIIYELHVKEFSWDRSGGFSTEYRGKYLAFTQEHTTLFQDGVHSTGLDYLKQLGVTYIQLMPVYDYGSVDEKKQQEFNWGYDPMNYNVPEGSYSTDPEQGEVRIREFKEMVKALHDHGFRVIMDVVYNHMYHLDTSLNRVMPWYYFRIWEDGTVSNGSDCGNDVASEREMCSRYILDSILYWTEEYHIDGFRFDLMGLLDVDLMNKIRRELDKRYGKGEILVFGEPWAADETAMEEPAIPALKKNIRHLDIHVGMFCDDTRDAVKGHVFEALEPGFVNGGTDLEQHILNSVKAWCIPETGIKAPSQIITYVSAHDNWTLWDKLGKTIEDRQKRLQANRLAAGIYMTCQGNLFLLSGEEFARTKGGRENTYNASVEINRLDWERAWEQQELVTYYQGLIALRKQLPGLCDKSEQAGARIFGAQTDKGAVHFFVDNTDRKEKTAWKTLCIIYNSTEETVTRELPGENWELLADGENSFLWKERRTIKKAEAGPVSILVAGQRETKA